jgi:nicotinamidase-related amidase
LNSGQNDQTGAGPDNLRPALLIMDYQADMIGMQPESVQSALLDRAARLLDRARNSGVPVFYVVVQFREGYPEISPQNKLFSSIRDAGRLIEGAPLTRIHPRVAPKPGEPVVVKRRVGAFSTTDLEALLRARNIRHLILFGIATGGVVLSTVRWAADMDYLLTVISDACADRDPEVHRILTEKVFPRQAKVLTTEEFLSNPPL